MNLEDFEPEESPGEYTLVDRWILSRYQKAVAEVTGYLESYELEKAARVLYEFIWREFCDCISELVKRACMQNRPGRTV